jgi:hypothetical protein
MAKLILAVYSGETKLSIGRLVLNVRPKEKRRGMSPRRNLWRAFP